MRFTRSVLSWSVVGVSASGRVSPRSRALWRCYTHPASAMSSHRPDSEGWRRREARDAFASVLDAVRSPRPAVCDIPIDADSVVEEAAHAVRRALHAIGDPQLAAAVVGDVEAEVAAVERAE